MHYTPSREDYLVTVFLLSCEQSQVRSTAVADRLGVTKPSAFAVLHLLADNGLLTIGPDKTLTLTPSGRQRAIRINDRCQLVYRFLTQALAVAPFTAEADAQAINHLLSEETQTQMRAYLLAHNQ